MNNTTDLLHTRGDVIDLPMLSARGPWLVTSAEGVNFSAVQMLAVTDEYLRNHPEPQDCGPTDG